MRASVKLMRVLAFATGLVAAPHSSVAAEPEAVPLPEYEVTEKPISEAEQRAPTAFISVVDTSTRDREFVTATEVLQELVGVQVQQFGGLGAFSTISIRGSTANQVPVYLDGIPLSQAQDETVNLADLPLESLQRIEVYRGTIPVAFGGGGIGGVVNLVTKPPSATPSTEVSVGYGSFETRKVVASHTQQLAGWDALAHLTYLGSKGDFTFEEDNPATGQATKQTRINNEFNSVGLLLKGTRDVGDGLAVDLTEEFFFKDQGVPGAASFQNAKASLREARSLTYARLRAPQLAGGLVNTSASLFGVYNLQEFDNPFEDPNTDLGPEQATRNQTALVGGSNTGTWYAPWSQAISWFDGLSYEQFFPFNGTNEPTSPNDGPDQTRLRLTLALQDEIPLISDRVTFVPSLRYEHLLDQFSEVNNINFPTTSPQTSNVDLWTPAAGVQARLTPWLAVRANIGRFQRAPNFSELFGNTGTVEGNANLKPETGINRDVGFVASMGQHGWLDRANLEYAYFHNNVSDLIDFQLVRVGVFQAANVSNARIEGHEVSLTAGAFRHFGIEMNYTHQDSADLSLKDNPFGNQLPLRPADDLFARTELFNDWGKVFYEYTYISSDPTDPFNFIIVPSRSIHTVGCTITPLSWLAFKFEAANITNADIRDLGDFPLPGVSFFGSIKVTL
jgi:iron complex outermembrane receptor protein